MADFFNFIKTIIVVIFAVLDLDVFLRNKFC